MSDIKFYAAPMEGITGYTYRTVHGSCYPGTDLYFSPFISPNQHHGVNPKEKRDISPKNNQGIHLIPQILTNKSDFMLSAAGELKTVYGYEEVNLNLGCPSKTVVSKGKGSGFLEDTQGLDRFFDEVFSAIDQAGGMGKDSPYPKISVKTRLGMEDTAEFEDILKVYNRYPLSELIVHPRVQKEFYKGLPHLETFAEVVESCTHSLCYNGDIWSLEDYKKIRELFPKVKKVMLGRGLIANPELVKELQEYEKCMAKGEVWTGYRRDFRQLKRYHDKLLSGYLEQMLGDQTNTLFKMKECWVYMERQFPEQEKLIKKLKKAGKLAEYERLAEELFAE